MTDSNAFLGSGWGFPPTFDNRSGTVQLVQAEADIAQSLEILLSTALGERVMQPTYGCNLDSLLFDTLSESTITYIKDLVETAILYHEARIELEKVSLSLDEQNQGKVLIEVDYLIRSTNSRANFVYPFYLEEGLRQP
ncbi:MAG: GPW/gp25 family protein [Bacteroidota bacterium]